MVKKNNTIATDLGLSSTCTYFWTGGYTGAVDVEGVVYACVASLDLMMRRHDHLRIILASILLRTSKCLVRPSLNVMTFIAMAAYEFCIVAY